MRISCRSLPGSSITHDDLCDFFFSSLASSLLHEPPKAPSAFLCVAVLSLHSDQAACGHRLISHCRSLSRKLTNPEVDACLLADIMRQLLFSAKLMFVKVGRSQDLAVCDRSVMGGVRSKTGV